MGFTYEDLGHAGPPAGALDHLRLALGCGEHIHFGETDSLLGQQALCGMAKTAERGSIDFNGLHLGLRSCDRLYIGR